MIIKLLICIPTYNNEKTVAAVAAECLQSFPYTLLVVDDGSDVEVESLPQWPKDPGRLFVARHNVNRGKGQALITAMEWATARGYTHLLTLDGDGQHLPSEIPRLIAALKDDPWAICIGARKFGENVPGSSQFGRKFSNFWVKYQTGREIQDSQSGFRIYPLFPLQTLNFWTRRYDFEIEVLIKAMWNGVEIRDVPIDVYYPPPQERVSHFDKWKDNVRISLLNTLLVIMSLLRSHTQPVKSAWAVAVGVFIGCSPAFGLHTILAAVASFIGRLNFPIVWAATQISIPPLIPFLVAGSVALGHWVLGGDLRWPQGPFDFATIGEGLQVYVIGSLILGSTIATIAGGLTYLVAWRWCKAKQHRRNWTGKMRGGRFGNGFIRMVLRSFGLNAGYFCLHFIVPYFYVCAPRARRGLHQYWQIRQPQWTRWQRRRAVYNHLMTFARVLLDRAYQAHQEQPYFDCLSEGPDAIAEPLKSGRPFVLLTAHMGSWDLAASSFDRHGVSGKINILEYEATGLSPAKVFASKQRNVLNRLVIREGEQPVLKVYTALSQGEGVAMMGDRPFDSNYELVPLFGKLAPIPTTAFRLALSANSEVIFTFGFKEQGRSYRFFAQPMELVCEGSAVDRTVAARNAAFKYAQVLEQFLERYPYQWFNFYQFWSQPPTLPNFGPCRPTRYYLEQELQLPQAQGLASAVVATPSGEPRSPLTTR